MTMTSMQWSVAPAIAPVDTGKQMDKQNLTIDDLLTKNAEYDAFKRDYEIPSTHLWLDHTGVFGLSDGERRIVTLAHIEDGALKQMCARYGNAFMGGAIPFQYARSLIDQHPDLYRHILDNHARDYGKNIFLRTYADGIRAVMSDRFTHIDNKDVLGMLKTYLDDKGGGNYTLVRPYIGRDGMNVRIMVKSVMPPDTDSPYGLGCVIRTGEIGNTSPQVLPFIQRHSCTNSTVWVDGGITLRQQGQRDSKLMVIAGAIGEAIQSSVNVVKRMLAARYEALPTLASVIGNICEEEGWGEEVKFGIIQGTERQDTVAGLVNGLTAAAHHPELDAETAISMEMLGGKLLMEPAYIKSYGGK